MDDLLKTAVVGTAQANSRLEKPATAIDRAVEQLDAHSAERRLLLAAGARAVRRRAGVRPLASSESNDVADHEMWEVAPPRTASLLGELLTAQNANLSAEALERLQGTHLLMPPALLPAALDTGTRSTAIRPALCAVIGQRGRWLARQNKSWNWAAAPNGNELAANAETIWQEGTQAERLNALRIARMSDPVRGRTMLESTWLRERATFRAEAIDILSVNLSTDDQSFLESALEDRAQAVRERTDALLVRLPGSQIARDAVSRAERHFGKRLGFQIVVRAPESDANSSDVERAESLIRTFSRVPPSHWDTRLGKQPADLVSIIARDRDWGFSVVAGWTQAAILFEDADWAKALWPYWLTVSVADLGKAAKKSDAQLFVTVNQQLVALLQVMGPYDAEQAVANQLAARSNVSRIVPVLPSLSRPWSEDFADRYLHEIRGQAEAALNVSSLDWQNLGHWVAPLNAATLALPAGRLENAIALMNRLIDTAPKEDTGELRKHWKRTLKSNIDTLQMRRRIYEEIPG